MPWLERVVVEVIRRRVEDVGLGVFAELKGPGIFRSIDSVPPDPSSGGRPFRVPGTVGADAAARGDRPRTTFFAARLPAAVLEQRFWNEQYLLEAFLTGNRERRLLGL